MATEIRKISFSNMRQHFGREIKFVTEEMGHLWLTQYGEPRCVLIPMRDEAVLHRALGLDPAQALHNVMVKADRMVAAINECQRWRSEPVTPLSGFHPLVGMDDQTYRKWRASVRVPVPDDFE